MGSQEDELFELFADIGTTEKPYLGNILTIAPLAQDEEFYFTLPKGKGTNLWFGFLSWLGNKGYEVIKVDETLDVSAVDQGYYALTQRHKEELEGKIKQGLASASQAVADYELIAHDSRKYMGFLKMLKTGDEHSLRATFIDEVDIHTAANSIKQMVARWPTMIADFMKLGDFNKGTLKDETDVGKIADALKVSKAEAVILSTKQRLYKNWKEMFGSEVEMRCKRIIALKNSREITINEYRDWLRPIVARHKMYRESLATGGGASGTAFSPFASPAQAISSNIVEIWAWQPMVGIVGRAGTMETKGNDFAIDPLDEFIKKKLIMPDEIEVEDKKFKSLKAMHPWMDEEWVKETAKRIKGSGKMKPDELYYAFLRMKYERAIMRTPDGTEIEDLTFKPKMYFFSQNAIMFLLLHFEAVQKEFENYIEQMIGISDEKGVDSGKQLEDIVKKWTEEEKKESEKKGKPLDTEPIRKGWGKVSKLFGFNFELRRKGPYEHNFSDRITTPFLATEAVDFYAPIIMYLMDGVGVGK